MPVYRVDGAHVRTCLDVGFIGGGHPLVPYRYIKRAIWIEQLGNAREEVFILAHELLEWVLMKYKGLSYEKAHAAANRLERKLRRGGAPFATFRTALEAQFPGHWLACANHAAAMARALKNY